MEFKYQFENKIRLDQFLSQEIDFLSREKIKTMIKEGLACINGVVVTKPKMIVKQFDDVTFFLKEDKINEELVKWEEGVMPEIIFETDDYLIINKPSGLVVHPGVGNMDKTLVNILIAQDFPLSKIDSPRPGIVHRIDKNTSGLMIIAKTDKFHDFISQKFVDGEIEKRYELITDGKYKTAKGIIEVPIGRDPHNRKLMKATLDNGKYAKSIFVVKESFKENEYVEFKILTGKTHQIRVHSKFIGAPILNDPEYGKNTFDPNFGQYLHAKFISFIDMDGNKKTFETELPIEMNNKLEELRGLKIV